MRTPHIDAIGSARRFVNDPTPENREAVENDGIWTAYEAQTSRETVLHPAVEYVWNGADFFVSGRSISEITASSISMYGNQDSHIAEHMLGVLPAALVRANKHTGSLIRTLSLPNGDAEDEQLMIRDMWFEHSENGELSLVTQQLSYAAGLVDEAAIESIYKAVGVSGGIIDEEKLKTTVIDIDGSPTLAEAAAQIDALLGPQVVGGKERNVQREEFYERLEIQRDNYFERAQRIGVLLGGFAVEMALEDVQHNESNAKFHDKVNELLHDLAESNPELARYAFGDKVAELYDMAHAARQMGEYELADQFVAQAREEGDTLYCDFDRCGIIRPSQDQLQQAQHLGLIGEVYLLEDNNCPDCKQSGGVMVDEVGNMACAKCDVSSVKAREDQQPATIDA